MTTNHDMAQDAILTPDTVQISQRIEVRRTGESSGVKYVVMRQPYIDGKGRKLVDLLYRGRHLHTRPIDEVGLYPEGFEGEKRWTAYLID